MRDDIDPQLLPIFLEEAQTLLPQIGSDLRDWKAHPQDEKVQQSLQRGLHTLKGSARMAGAIRLGELTHLMEGRIEAALEAGAVGDRAVRRARGEDGPPEPRTGAHGGRPGGGGDAGARGAGGGCRRSRPPRVARAEAPPLPAPAAMLRVNADTLDHLINESGEVSIARSRIEAELRAVKQSIADLNESIARLRGQLREVEIQADSQMRARQSELERAQGRVRPARVRPLYAPAGAHAPDGREPARRRRRSSSRCARTWAKPTPRCAQQSRTSRDVQQELMRMRAVPFSILDERLYRIVRQTARELGKKAELHIEGSQVELDRSVLEPHRRAAGAHAAQRARARRRGARERARRRQARDRRASRSACARKATKSRWSSATTARASTWRACGARLRRTAWCSPARRSREADLMQLIFVSGLSTADVGHRARRPRHRHGRGEERDRRDRRPRRHRQHARAGHHLHDLPAAHARGDAGGHRARRRQRARGLGGDGRAGAAPEGRRAGRALRRAGRSSSRIAATRCTASRSCSARAPPRRRPTTRCCCCAAACSASRCTSTS